jgi:hypothetical protein
MLLKCLAAILLTIGLALGLRLYMSGRASPEKTEKCAAELVTIDGKEFYKLVPCTREELQEQAIGLRREIRK